MLKGAAAPARRVTRSSYRLLPDIALADVAYRARADTLGGLLEAAARALTDVMVDRRTVGAAMEKTLKLSAPDTDRLLYDFLTELIILKDVDSLLFKQFQVKVGRDGRALACKMKGEPIDREKHGLRNDVKAVTMHLFGVRRTGRLWEATVVLDI